MALFSKKKEEGSEKQPVEQEAKSVVAKKEAKAEPSMKELYGEENKAVVKKETKDGKKTVVTAKNGQAYRILIKPIITEKGGSLASMSKYVFEVAKNANKIEVAKAIQEVYGIMPEKVNLMRLEGKTKQRGKVVGKRKDWKKAIVTLPKGKNINVYEGV